MPQHIIIDFDSTFVSVESLDEFIFFLSRDVKKKSSLHKEVKELTDAGMNGEIDFNISLSKRLELIDAGFDDIISFISLLQNNVTKSFVSNINFIKKNSSKIIIISGGFCEFIAPIVSRFNIGEGQIFANRFKYNELNKIIGVDKTTPFFKAYTKTKLVRSLNLHGEIHVIGDGFTDYEIWAHEEASRFFAFIENIKRENVINHSDDIIQNIDEYIKIISLLKH
tara:strand:- start:1445 stop:2116 length:672 start_codon:yes stop_codon:yes gene_type:complete